MANESAEKMDRAMSLLRQATAVLSGNYATPHHDTSSTDNGNHSDNSSTSRSILGSGTPDIASTSRTPIRSSLPTSSVGTESALRNFQALFGPYSNTALRAGTHKPPNKKVCKRKQSTINKARETWTHEVFCLANTDQQAIPSRSQKVELQGAALGRSKVRFDANATSKEFKEKLEEVFPKLLGGGGFELLRRGPSGNELVLIRSPPSGYTVPYLRDSSGIGQALLFIRPLQMNLDASPETDVIDFDSEVINDAITVLFETVR